MNSNYSWDKLEWLSDARSLLDWVVEFENSPAALLVRHSERLVNLSPSDTLKAELTPVGHEMAREFGRRLPKEKKVTLLHSPNIRTKQTAERIAEGVEEKGGKTGAYEIVGVDESDPSRGRISWISPLARALISKQVGETVQVNLPGRNREYKIKKIENIETGLQPF